MVFSGEIPCRGHAEYLWSGAPQRNTCQFVAGPHTETKNFASLHGAFVPQIAIAIGDLTSNRGGGRRTTLADWTWHQGASAGCSGRGAFAVVGCHCSVLWLGGRVTANFAIVVCYGWGGG